MKKIVYWFAVAVMSLMFAMSANAKEIIFSAEPAVDGMSSVLLYDDGELVINGEGEMMDFSEGSYSPFYEHIDQITSVTISEGITSIGGGLFNGCEYIEEITLPDSITYIGDLAFSRCFRLKTINIPNKVESIGQGAFGACRSLEKIDLPESVKSIGAQAFRLCSNLKTIDIPDEVEKIEQATFGQCYSLESVFLPDELISIDSYAFTGCVELKSIDIPATVEIIGDRAFNACVSLQEIVIPERVAELDCVFIDCNSLDKLVLTGKDIALGVGFIHVFYKPAEGVNFDNWISKYKECLKASINYEYGYEYGSGYGGDDADTVLEEKYNEWFPITQECSAAQLIPGLTIFGYLGSTAEAYANENNVAFEEISNYKPHTHTPKTVIIPHSCTVPGMQYDICSDCGETIGAVTVIPAAHTPGEWETLTYPTYELEGKKIIKCTACGEILQDEAIPKLEKPIVVDEKTGIEIEYEGVYNGKVGISVEETFDGNAINIVNATTGGTNSKIYDIKMTVNGNVVQPLGKVTVRIPLPEGYNPKRCFIYYVNIETSSAEEIEAKYENGYMVFETDHFSYYAIAEIPDKASCSCKCHASGIKKFFFNFILFFQKLFKKNAVCDCGIAHY